MNPSLKTRIFHPKTIYTQSIQFAVDVTSSLDDCDTGQTVRLSASFCTLVVSLETRQSAISDLHTAPQSRSRVTGSSISGSLLPPKSTRSCDGSLLYTESSCLLERHWLQQETRAISGLNLKCAVSYLMYCDIAGASTHVPRRRFQKSSFQFLPKLLNQIVEVRSAISPLTNSCATQNHTTTCHSIMWRPMFPGSLGSSRQSLEATDNDNVVNGTLSNHLPAFPVCEAVDGIATPTLDGAGTVPGGTSVVPVLRFCQERSRASRRQGDFQRTCRRWG